MSLLGVEAVVRDRFGLDPEAQGATALPRAVEARMNAIGVTTINDYLAIVISEPAEQHALAAELAVPETWFFRGALAVRHACRAHPRSPGHAPDQPSGF